MKKRLSLILIAILLLSAFVGVVFAQTILGNENDTGTITVTVLYNNNPQSGVRVGLFDQSVNWINFATTNTQGEVTFNNTNVPDIWYADLQQIANYPNSGWQTITTITAAMTISYGVSATNPTSTNVFPQTQYVATLFNQAQNPTTTIKDLTTGQTSTGTTVADLIYTYGDKLQFSTSSGATSEIFQIMQVGYGEGDTNYTSNPLTITPTASDPITVSVVYAISVVVVQTAMPTITPTTSPIITIAKMNYEPYEIATIIVVLAIIVVSITVIKRRKHNE